MSVINFWYKGIESEVVDPDEIISYFDTIPVKKDYAPYPN